MNERMTIERDEYIEYIEMLIDNFPDSDIVLMGNGDIEIHHRDN